MPDTPGSPAVSAGPSETMSTPSASCARRTPSCAVSSLASLVDTSWPARRVEIEGRTKSQYYVTRTAQTYRRAIDDAVSGRPFNPKLITELEGLANRGFTSGFLEAGYRRLLERRLRETFGFDGSPIRINVRVREKRGAKR